MTVESTSESAIFERIVLPGEPQLTRHAAQSLLAMGFAQEDRLRMAALAEKARQGTLSGEEQQEIDNYERVGHYLSILQSKARLALRTPTENAS